VVPPSPARRREREVVAIDVAILPPADITTRAIEASAALPDEGSQGLRLDAEHLPHITLTQQFIRAQELNTAFDVIAQVLAGQPPLRVLITGGGRGGHTVWLTVERTPALLDLHERLMEALRGLERPDAGPHAFFEGNGRVGDVLWVASFRLKSSFGAYTPHVTLGHAAEPPTVAPMAFDATTIAACHLGRFCTCRKILRSWTLHY
jgi:2'-5' RNA ligase